MTIQLVSHDDDSPSRDRRRLGDRRESVRVRQELEETRRRLDDMRRITRDVLAFLIGMSFSLVVFGLFA